MQHSVALSGSSESASSHTSQLSDSSETVAYVRLLALPRAFSPPLDIALSQRNGGGRRVRVRGPGHRLKSSTFASMGLWGNDDDDDDDDDDDNRSNE